MTWFRRGGSDQARAASLPSAAAPRLSGRAVAASGLPSGRTMLCWRITPSFPPRRPGREFRPRLGVGHLGQRRAAGEDLALIDVTLAGDLAGVKTGRAGATPRRWSAGRALPVARPGRD